MAAFAKSYRIAEAPLGSEVEREVLTGPSSAEAVYSAVPNQPRNPSLPPLSRGSEYGNPMSLLARGHRPEIMFGVLVVVLGRDPIARLDFGLGQCQITFIVFLRVVGAVRC
jgi:hypothetical protein